MMTIIHDPTGSQRLCVGLDPSRSLHDNIAEHLPQGGGDYEVWLNGEPLAQPGKILKRQACVSDRVTVVRRPGEAALNAVASIISGVVGILLPRPDQPAAASSVGQSESPNNRLTGQTNIARTYEAIPDVYGNVRCWPDLIQNSTTEYVDNVKRVTEWLCVSRGKGTITDIKYADTPLADISGSVATVFEPVAAVDGLYENGTTTLTDVLEMFDSAEVNGQELGYPDAFVLRSASADVAATTGVATFTLTTAVSAIWDELVSIAGAGTALVAFSYGGGGGGSFSDTCSIVSVSTVGPNYVITFSVSGVWSGPTLAETVTAQVTPNGYHYTTIGPYTLAVSGDRLRWHVNFLRGLKGSVGVKAEWWAVDGSGVEIGGTRQNQTDTFTADSFDGQYRTVTVTPSAGVRTYRIEFTRTTAQIGTDGLDVAKLEEVSVGRYYATKALPGVTVIKAVTTATTQATGFSERKFNCEWTRWVRPLTGISLSASRNFARAIVHLWAVAGRDAAEIDVDALAAVNAAHGETSELLRFDYTFADRNASLGERLQRAANAARCRVYRDGLQWVTVRDELRAVVPSRQFDYRNLAAGGESTITESGHLPAQEDGVEIEYVADDGKTKAYVRLVIDAAGMVSAGTPAAPLKIQLIGCRTVSQALNRAHLEARKIIYQRRRVADTALMDAATCGLGEVIRWIDPNDFLGDDGLQAGEVLTIAGTTITTSEPLAFGDDTEGRVVFTLADGSPSAQVTCVPRTDGGTGCIVSSVPTGVSVATAYNQCGSRYAFATGVTEAELESSGLYVLETKRPKGDGTIEISLVNYDERIYEMD